MTPKTEIHTFADTPDGVTSFGFTDFSYPVDSIDLRNAVYVIPGTTVPTVADSATETITTTANVLGKVAAAIGTFAAAGAAAPALVGNLGPFTFGITASSTPTFGQPTLPGNLLTAWVGAGFASAITCTSPGWILLRHVYAFGPEIAQIWYKPNSAANESPPTFTITGGMNYLYMQLAEWSGIRRISPADQSGESNLTSTKTVTATTGGVDAILGGLVLLVTSWPLDALTTGTWAGTINNGGTLINAGNPGAVTDQYPSSFSYSILPALARPKWYTDEASIALYGRREASLTDTSS